MMIKNKTKGNKGNGMLIPQRKYISSRNSIQDEYHLLDYEVDSKVNEWQSNKEQKTSSKINGRESRFNNRDSNIRDNKKISLDPYYPNIYSKDESFHYPNIIPVNQAITHSQQRRIIDLLQMNQQFNNLNSDTYSNINEDIFLNTIRTPVAKSNIDNNNTPKKKKSKNRNKGLSKGKEKGNKGLSKGKKNRNKGLSKGKENRNKSNKNKNESDANLVAGLIDHEAYRKQYLDKYRKAAFRKLDDIEYEQNEIWLEILWCMDKLDNANDDNVIKECKQKNNKVYRKHVKEAIKDNLILDGINVEAATKPLPLLKKPKKKAKTNTNGLIKFNAAF